MNKNDWAKIRENVDNGVFKVIRLVRVEADGKHTVLIPYNRKTDKKEALQRFEYMKMKCENLPVGKYQVQCKAGGNHNGLTDAFELEVKQKVMLHISPTGEVEDKTKEQTTMENISLHDYIELVEKCATLTANNRVLNDEVNFYKNEMMKLQTVINNKALADGSDEGGGGKGVWEVLGSTLKEIAPSLINMQDRYLGVLEKREENKAVQLSGGKVKKIPMAKQRPKQKTVEDIANDYADLLEPLMDSDPDKFNAELDKLEEEMPDVYEIVCELLELEMDEEEQEEEEEQE